MAKRRRPARANRSPERTLRQAQASDGAGLVMTRRLLQGGPEYLHENFIRLMQDSAHLQPEPEFANLYFDLEPTLVIAAKQFRRFKRRLEAAVKAKDHDAFATTYDDYRIAAIAELATPAFKQQLKQGLEQCMERLRDSREVELLESVTFISVLWDSTELTEDKFPLGIYGLVTMIYEASFERAMLKLPDAPELAGQDLTILWQAYYRTKDLAILEQAVEAAPTFAELLNTLENNSKLAVARQRQADHLVKELQEKTIGKRIWFSRNFFTPAEIKLSLDMMETRYLSKPWYLSRYFSLLTIFNFLKCI
jgi:hypothetical protein